MDILNKNGEVIFTSQKETIKEVVEEVVNRRDSLSGANLRGADLRGAILEVANLGGAILEGANLDESTMDKDVNFFELLGINKINE